MSYIAASKREVDIGAKIEMIGRRFGRLKVTGEADSVRYMRADKKDLVVRQYRVICDCKTKLIVRGDNLRNGLTLSCGCLNRERFSHRSHGHKDGGKTSPEYQSWQGMLNRCRNPNVKRYPNYGGRGIKVCKRWHKFENFLADMGTKPSSSHSIDRYPNNDGDYKPSNCRWATPKQQANNQRPRKKASAR